MLISFLKNKKLSLGLKINKRYFDNNIKSLKKIIKSYKI